MTDGVLFQWLDDAGSGATGLQLQVDGVTVQTVDGRTKGSYYYAMPGGMGSHTIGYRNNGVTTTTVDSPYLYANNRSSGVQIWEVSHRGWTTAQYAASDDLTYYITQLQPHAVQICTQTNDAPVAVYSTSLAALLPKIINNITIRPSLGIFSNFETRNHPNWNLMQAEAQLFARTNNAALLDAMPLVDPIDGVGNGPDSLNWTVDGIHPSSRTIKGVLSPLMLSTWNLMSVPAVKNVDQFAISVSGTTYTVSGYERKVMTTSSSPVTISVPQPVNLMFTGTPLNFGSTVEIIQQGTGTVTVTPTSGNIRSATGSLVSPGQYSSLFLTVVSLSEWAFTTRGALPAGTLSRSIISTSSNITAGAAAGTDYVYLVTGAHTITLPTAVGNTNRYTIRNNHSAAITVDTTSSQTIDGTTTISVPATNSVDIISNNANWSVI